MSGRDRLAIAVPGYEIGAELGHGGNGVVLAGRDLATGRDVAIKVLSGRISSVGNARDRFLSVGRILSGVWNPHVAGIEDFAEHDGLCVLVTERLPGRVVIDPRDRLPTAVVCAIGLAAATALDAAHTRGVLHRGMKPTNIMLTADRTPKVTDFGTSTLLEAMAAAPDVEPSAAYLAPEQINGRRLGPATDLYALGLVLYELLTGRPPFGRNLTATALRNSQLVLPPAPLDDAPAPLAAVVMRLLEKSPSARYPSAQDLALDLAIAARRALGPDWIAESGVPLHVDGAVLSAARGDGKDAEPDLPRPAAPPVTPGGTIRPRVVPVGSTVHKDAFSRNDNQVRTAGGAQPPAGAVVPARPDRDPPASRRPRTRTVVIAGVIVLVGGGVAIAATRGHSASPTSGTGVVAATTGPSPTPSTRPPATGAPITVGAYGGAPITISNLEAYTLSIDGSGDLFVNAGQSRIDKIAPDGTITQIAGSGQMGYMGDNGPATKARVSAPTSVAVDPATGTTYLVDVGNSRVRRIDRQGVLTTYAGSGATNDSGDGGPATSAGLDGPIAVAYDSAGQRLLVLEQAGSRIRAVGRDGTITTLPVYGAALNQPQGIAVDPSGAIFIADTENNSIRRIGPSGRITTVAGTGTPGFTGDGGPATAAELFRPTGVFVDRQGVVYIADRDNNRIRRVGTNGRITTIGGTGATSFGGDGGPATRAIFNIPNALVVDTAGNLYVADYGNNRIRRIAMNGTVTTVVAQN